MFFYPYCVELKAVAPQLYKHKRFKTAKGEEQSICKIKATIPDLPLSCHIKLKKKQQQFEWKWCANESWCFLMRDMQACPQPSLQGSTKMRDACCSHTRRGNVVDQVMLGRIALLHLFARWTPDLEDIKHCSHMRRQFLLLGTDMQSSDAVTKIHAAEILGCLSGIKPLLFSSPSLYG